MADTSRVARGIASWNAVTPWRLSRTVSLDRRSERRAFLSWITDRPMARAMLTENSRGASQDQCGNRGAAGGRNDVFEMVLRPTVISR